MFLGSNCQTVVKIFLEYHKRILIKKDLPCINQFRIFLKPFAQFSSAQSFHMLVTYGLCFFFKLRQCHSKKPLNHFLPALLLFGLNPLILFSLTNMKAHCLRFVAVIGKPDFATSHILLANSPSSFFDSILASFLPPDLCPSPSTLPLR